MEQETSQSEQAADTDLDLVRRRAALATAFQALPTYGSAEFWSLVEESQLKLAGLLKSYSPHSDKGVCVGVAWWARRTCEKP